MGSFKHIVNVASIQWQLSTVKEVDYSVQTNVGHATQFYLQPETKQEDLTEKYCMKRGCCTSPRYALTQFYSLDGESKLSREKENQKFALYSVYLDCMTAVLVC